MVEILHNSSFLHFSPQLGSMVSHGSCEIRHNESVYMVETGKCSTLNLGGFVVVAFQILIVKHFPPWPSLPRLFIFCFLGFFFQEHCVPILGNSVIDDPLMQKSLRNHIRSK